MWEHIDREDRRLLKPIAQAEAQDFLRAQLKRVEMKIRDQSDYLERRYSPGDESRQGVEQMLQVYAQEKEIIEALMLDCQEEILPDVFQRRMLENEKARSTSRAGGLPTINAESSYWQLRRESEMLKDLLRRWNQRFRPSENEEGGR